MGIATFASKSINEWCVLKEQQQKWENYMHIAESVTRLCFATEV
jgi:hypothetical protein